MKQLLFHEEARNKLKEGVDLVTDAVKITLGPKGRNVVISRPHKGEPDIINDGATIARNIAVKDQFKEQGVELVKSIALKTESSAGDGTTTSAILAQAIIDAGLEAIKNGANPVMLRNGIEDAIESVIEFLKSKAIPIKPENLSKIATLSAEDEKIGNIIAEILNIYGIKVAISSEESSIPGISYEVVEGYQFERGWVSPYMINKPNRFETVLEDIYVAIFDRKINMISDLIPLLELVIKKGNKKELVIIAEEISGDALATLILNIVQSKFRTLAINAPGFGKQRADFLDDMAMFTGATKISAELGMKMEDMTIEMLGKCQKVVSNRESTVLIGGYGLQKEIDERVKQLEYQIEQNKDGGTDYFEKQLKERIGKLTGKAVIIRSGYDSETEATYKKLKIDDTIAATRAALEEGILPGGGTQYLWASIKCQPKKEEKDYLMGWRVITEALSAPIKQLALNSGMNPKLVIEKITSEDDNFDKNLGLNALTGEYVDLLEMGIIDPLKVERLALINATSVAKTLLTADVVIVDEIEEKK